ncbi:MAG: A/G-specific adenine glycosylase [Bacteroidetes bacterium HGW-Bacteroidetes-21]|jgi:A/G-specific adenine glycosylase|nr:MAG: A/G-specific adenine glycosylase [Bacteroidetes bacterium HGW-Bacteroidetes-21]
MIFRDILKKWNEKNRQKYFWRINRSIYQLWVSEIIFQQTRIAQGEEYYQRFIARFPTVQELASASRDEVLRLWQGLGYYSRALNLHKAARMIVDENNGQFPINADSWQKIPGVGPYTAAAISSIANGECIPAIDGNVKRIVSRWLEIESPMDTADFTAKVTAFLNEHIPKKKPGLFNEALMDFGSKVCIPGKPDCKNCPFIKYCGAGIHNTVSKYPVKKKNFTKKKKSIVYFVIQHNNNIIMKQRDGEDLWKHMYDFPAYETEGHLNKITPAILKHMDPFQPEEITTIGPMKHELTHITLKIFFLRAKTKSKLTLPKDHHCFSIEKAMTLAKPRPAEKFLDQMKNTYLCHNK